MQMILRCWPNERRVAKAEVDWGEDWTLAAKYLHNYHSSNSTLLLFLCMPNLH